jgi:hypothetical protein
VRTPPAVRDGTRSCARRGDGLAARGAIVKSMCSICSILSMSYCAIRTDADIAQPRAGNESSWDVRLTHNALLPPPSTASPGAGFGF